MPRWSTLYIIMVRAAKASGLCLMHLSQDGREVPNCARRRLNRMAINKRSLKNFISCMYRKGRCAYNLESDHIFPSCFRQSPQNTARTAIRSKVSTFILKQRILDLTHVRGGLGPTLLQRYILFQLLKHRVLHLTKGKTLPLVRGSVPL